MSESSAIRWPNGARFAFTIVDDTDQAVLDNIRPVYDFLAECGFRTTKTVWPLKALGRPITGGDSLENEEYLKWILSLKAQGFEIALHGVADEPSTRERVILGLQRFEETIGSPPETHINHVGQTEGLYWGPDRLDIPARWLFRAYRRMHAGPEHYSGHRPGSDYFWGDLCCQKIRFVRNLVWPDVNTLRMDPLMPYHDPRRPFVPYWFSSSYGSGLKTFLRLLRPENQDRLMEENGACIVYTHLGSKFHPITEEFRSTMRRLASLPGWFVPVSTLLQHVGAQRGWQDVSKHPLAFRRMQLNWLFQQFLRKVG